MNALLRAAAVGMTSLFLGALPADAQQIPAAELDLVQRASDLEEAGDLAGADALLRRALEAQPNSLSAILTLERIMRMRGEVENLLPFIERLLATDRESAIGHQMRVRTFSVLNRVEEIERAADAWVRATPRLETPYREVARVWQQRGDAPRAIAILERGREQLGKDALALELGDLYAQRGDDSRATAELARAVGPDARGLTLVRRRLSLQPDAGAGVMPSLIDALGRAPTTQARQHAAVELAIDAGLAERALVTGRALLRIAAPHEKNTLLLDIARRADGAGLVPVAYWAYRELVGREGNDPAAQTLVLRARMAELALAVGDTAVARDAYRDLESGLAPGTPDRRRATAFRIQLTAREGRVREAAADLAAFRRAYGAVPEVDDVAAVVAESLLQDDEVASAEEAVAGVVGPRSSLLRGRIALRRGDPATARVELLAAAPRLHGAEATDVIALASLLGNVSAQAGKLIGQAAGREVADAVRLLSGPELDRLEAADRPVLLEYAAGAAERAGRPHDAARIRRVIVSEYAGSPTAPAALLALARDLAQDEAMRSEARELLERLIIEHPRSALVPQARRALDAMPNG